MVNKEKKRVLGYLIWIVCFMFIQKERNQKVFNYWTLDT